MNVLSLDYDGCGDAAMCPRIKRIINACAQDPSGTKLSAILKPLLDKLDQIIIPGRTRLLVGSARQSVGSDLHNRDSKRWKYHEYPALRMKPHEGYARRDFERFAKERGLILDRRLRPDNDEEAGVSWDDESRDMTDFDEMKTDLIRYQIVKTSEALGGEPFHFHFFDDRDDILTALNAMIAARPSWMPSNVGVSLYKFNWFESFHKEPALETVGEYHPTTVTSV